MSVVDDLIELQNWQEFRALVESRPEARGPEVVELLEAMGQNDGYGANFQLIGVLVKTARTDPKAAWDEYVDRRDEMAARAERAGAASEEIDRAIEQGRFDEVIELAQGALPEAKALGLGMAVSLLSKQLATALIKSSSGDRAQNIEEAISALQEALRFAFDDAWAADIAMHLGIAYGERIRGDRGENIEEAVRLLREVLANLSDETEPEMWAIARTNLASMLLRREHGERVENLRESAQLCEKALDYRCPERNSYDWAHTQVNLGVSLQELAALGERDPEAAEAAFSRVIEESARITTPWLIASAYYFLARSRRLRAVVGLDEFLDAQEFEQRQLEESNEINLAEAAELYAEARKRSEPAEDPVRHGRILSEFADVLEELGRDDEAIAVGHEAMGFLRPTSATHECAETAQRLAGILATRQAWNEAALVVRDAIEAAALSFHTRLDTHAREDEAKRVGNLARWAAFILAAAGNVPEAAVVLESGRTRELRRRLGAASLPDDLDALPGEARDAYLAALSALNREPLGPLGAGAARELQSVLAAIREMPGLEEFATGASEADFRGGIELGWPLMYVNPTPWGLLLLMVTANNEGVAIDADIADRPTSTAVVMRLMVGEHAELAPDEALEQAPGGSYLAAISGPGDDHFDPANEERRDMQRDLETALPWLGKHLSKSIWEALQEVDALGVTLIPCGPIGVAPLHAAPWSTSKGDRCLLDDLEVRYAPSALIAGVALDRADARARTPPSLVALADPAGDLPAARPEVEEIGRHFTGRIRDASGRSASHAFLREHAAWGSHIHLACHARGGLFDPEEAAITLSDGPISAVELTGLDVRARLTAVSACESGVADIAQLPDEVFSVGTAMIAAGSACAFVSLWPVLDFSAAVLMTRAYEEMLAHGHRPPEALRRAQLWLRGLSVDEELEYLGEHPALEAEFRRRRGEASPPVEPHDFDDCPYRHPDYWGAFIAVGA